MTQLWRATGTNAPSGSRSGTRRTTPRAPRRTSTAPRWSDLLSHRFAKGKGKASRGLAALLPRHPDRRQHAFGIPEYVVVPEPQHQIPTRFKITLACFIVVDCRRVLAAVEFDDETPLDADEVDDEWSDRLLPAKLERAKASGTQCYPQAALGVRRFAPHRLRTGQGHRRRECHKGFWHVITVATRPSPSRRFASGPSLSHAKARERALDPRPSRQRWEREGPAPKAWECEGLRRSTSLLKLQPAIPLVWHVRNQQYGYQAGQQSCAINKAIHWRKRR